MLIAGTSWLLCCGEVRVPAVIHADAGAPPRDATRSARDAGTIFSDASAPGATPPSTPTHPVVVSDGALSDRSGDGDSTVAVPTCSGDARGGLECSDAVAPLPCASRPARATRRIRLWGNLDAESMPPAAFDPSNPGVTSNSSIWVTVYDSLGVSHEINVYFSKLDATSVAYNVLVDASELWPAEAGINVVIGSGTLLFAPSGRLLNDVVLFAIATTFPNGGTVQGIVLDFGAAADGDSGAAGSLSQFYSPSTFSALVQDGYPPGGFGCVDPTRTTDASSSPIDP